MKSIQFIVVLSALLSADIMPAAASDRHRERELRVTARCDTFSAALSAARPQSYEARLKRFQDEEGANRPEWDYYWRSRAKKDLPPDPVCDGTILARVPPRFPVMCGGSQCHRMVPQACMFVEFGIDSDGATTEVETLARFPVGNSKTLRMYDNFAKKSVAKWCFPTTQAPDLADPDRRNVTSIRYSVQTDAFDWETPEDEGDAERHAEFFEPLSRAACADFVEDYDRLAGPRDAHAASGEAVAKLEAAWPDAPIASALNHACVVARFSVSADGVVADEEILLSAPVNLELEGFENAARAAVTAASFEPAAAARSNVLAIVNFEKTPE